MNKDEVYRQDERLSGLESRVSVLESKIDDGLNKLEQMFDARLENLEKVVDSIAGNVNELRNFMTDVREILITSKVKYNGYIGKFATKEEFSRLQMEVERIKAEEKGVVKFFSKWGSILALIVSLIAILKSIGVF